jgi:hypothetical protein
MEAGSSNDGVGNYSIEGFHKCSDWKQMVQNEEEVPRPVAKERK